MSSAPQPQRKPKVLRWRTLAWAVGAAIVALAAYSVYVGYFYAPDSQNTFVLGQTAFHADSPASVRVLVQNYVTGNPIEGAAVSLSLTGPDRRWELGRFRTDKSGSVAGAFNIPSLPAGSYKLAVATKSRVGQDLITRPVEIRWPCRAYLTTDKPIYQPGQTVHMRVMALHRSTLKPFAGHKVSFEVEDPKANKVFRKAVDTSSFGIASAGFDLADEVNLGRYRVKVVAGGVETEKVVTVRRYVLPKFKALVTTDKPYYLPAEVVTGKVEAAYFFGKPVAGAQVEIVGRTIIDEPVEKFRVRGATDGSGAFEFKVELPPYFVGIPLAGRDAWLEIAAQVTDAASHVEETSAQLRVSEDRIKIAVLPESGDPVPGVENLIYVLTAYPDGRPAKCRLTVNGTQAETDASGLAVVSLVPAQGPFQVKVGAKDAEGNAASLDRKFAVEEKPANLLLRTDKAVYSGGERVNVTVLSTTQPRTYFVDVIKDGQTVLTKSLDAVRGRGELALELPPGLFGTLKINAYEVTPLGESYADARVIFVRQQRELQIGVSADKPTYRPGETAELSFQVRDRSGQPVPAALGVCAVDEAVFHLAENRPGLLQQFFMADEEVLRPAYQIKFFASPERLLSGKDEDQRLALAAFSRAAGARRPTLGLSELANTYLDNRFVAHLRAWMDAGNYDALLKDERFSKAAEFLTGKGDYGLRASTYPAKEARAQVYRTKYFDWLGKSVLGLAVMAILVVPLAFSRMTAHKLRRPIARRYEDHPVQARVCRAVFGIADSTHVLVYFPIINYTAGLLILAAIFEPLGLEGVITVLLAMDVGVAGAMVAWQFRSCAAVMAAAPTRRHGAAMLLVPVGFLLQFVTTRTLGLLPHLPGWDPLNPISAAVILSLIAMFALARVAGNGNARMAKSFGVDLEDPAGGPWAAYLVIYFILAILAGMFLPSLARSRETVRGVAKSDLMQFEKALEARDETAPPGDRGAGRSDVPPRTRKHFPETLMWRPELITDDHGRAGLSIPLADSITTWRMNVDAVSAAGMLGGAEQGIRVFQDFFVDLDLPVALTQNDEISLPVACYNYLKQPQRVSLELQAGDWCQAQGPAALTVDLQPNEVKAVHFRLRAVGVGTHDLTVLARGERMSDAIQRRLRVTPDGTEVVDVRSGILGASVEHEFRLPPDAIANSQSLLLKVHPTRFSEVLEGLENIFRMPFGCFEQTSSCTYPNVLALLYMKSTGRATPEVEVKAVKFINAGYQRLLTFEVAGGGFDWFGHPPANVILTAYGILEFTDMAKVYDVDPAIVERAKKWLFSKQQAGGPWVERRRGSTWAGVSGELVTTAYVAWALAESGCAGREMDAALDYLRGHVGDVNDAYTLSLAANAFLAHDRHDPTGRELVARLHSQLLTQEYGAYFTSAGSGATYSRGYSLNVETTALAALAMLRDGAHPDALKKCLIWISRQKDANGTWQSTQATILAMKALLSGTGKALGADVRARIAVHVNGAPAGTIDVTPETSDVLQTLSLTQQVRSGRNVVRIAQERVQELPYQLVGAYWVPWKRVVEEKPKPLEIAVSYERTRLAVDDTLKCSVLLTNNTRAPVNMAIVDLGIPPGFSVETSSFDKMIARGLIAKYDTTGNQVILYVREMQPGAPLRLSYDLKAKYPIRAKTPPARVYEYYNPTNEGRAPSQEIVVEGT